MSSIEKSVLVQHSAEEMFALVADIESYPQFLPWCGGARILARDGTTVTAAIDINIHGIQQSFTTVNDQHPHDRIDMELVEGPFSRLDGGWFFTKLTAKACKVELSMDYEFSNFILGGLVGPVFHQIASSMVESFVRRADALANRAA